jgi:citrate lyase subunit beta / citryl-CoA lyase
VRRSVGRLRSLLFTPATRPDLVAKASSFGPDGVVIDCEDAVPPAAKEQARQQARTAARAALGGRSQIFVRVNGVDSAWFQGDVVDGLDPELAGVVLPKVDVVEELDEAARALARAGLGHLGLIAGIETAPGVADARSLLAHPAVVAAYFGVDDFVADMGGIRTAAGTEVLYARSQVVLAARLAGVPALDQAVTNLRDDALFLRECREARTFGYRGKLCLHPSQVLLANQAFLPSAAEVDRARRLLLAYEEAVGLGEAAIDFEGHMVDESLAAQARQLLASADEL